MKYCYFKGADPLKYNKSLKTKIQFILVVFLIACYIEPAAQIFICGNDLYIVSMISIPTSNILEN